MVPLLQRSERREGKRVGFGQAHNSRGPLVERAHASTSVGVWPTPGQARTYYCIQKPRGAWRP